MKNTEPSTQTFKYILNGKAIEDSKGLSLEVLTAIAEVSKNTSTKTRVVIHEGEVSVEFDHA